MKAKYNIMLIGIVLLIGVISTSVIAELCSNQDMYNAVKSAGGAPDFYAKCEQMRPPESLKNQNPKVYKWAMEEFYGCTDSALASEMTFINNRMNALSGAAYASGKSCNSIAQEYVNAEKSSYGSGLDSVLNDHDSEVQSGVNKCGTGFCNDHKDNINNQDQLAEAAGDLATQAQQANDAINAKNKLLEQCPGAIQEQQQCELWATQSLWHAGKGEGVHWETGPTGELVDKPTTPEQNAWNAALLASLDITDPADIEAMKEFIEENGATQYMDMFNEEILKKEKEFEEIWEEDEEEQEPPEEPGEEQEPPEEPGEEPEEETLPCWKTKTCTKPKEPLRPYSCQDNCDVIK
jgi:hypothetical protein